MTVRIPKETACERAAASGGDQECIAVGWSFASLCGWYIWDDTERRKGEGEGKQKTVRNTHGREEQGRIRAKTAMSHMC